jgi:hypothetical protein
VVVKWLLRASAARSPLKHGAKGKEGQAAGTLENALGFIINGKVLPGDNTALIAADPARFYMPAYIGQKSCVGPRLDTGEIDWEEVEELVKQRLTEPASARQGIVIDVTDWELTGEMCVE